MAVHAAAQTGHVSPHPTPGMSRGMAGMVLFIASEIMLFGGLFAGFFYLHNQAASWPPAGVEPFLAIEPYNIILTGILFASGICAHFGIVSLRQGSKEAFRTLILLTLVLGSIFIGMQIFEWLRFIKDDGFTASKTVYGGTFFVLTGFHGAHVIAGLCMLAAVLVRAFWDDFTPQRHLFADTSVLYWHFVDLIWVFVYLILYGLA